MSFAYWITLAWLAALLLSLAAVGIHAWRHGCRGLAVSLLCPLGAVLMFGFVSAAVGWAEGWWAGSPGLWIALSFGAAGAGLAALGWRAVLRPRVHPGGCPGCGYDLAGFPTCPECGRPRSGAIRRSSPPTPRS